MAAEAAAPRTWDCVLELTKAAQERGTDPLLWVMQLSSSLNAAGASMPCIEVAELLVSHICWSNNVPIAWKFLEKALTIRVVPPMLVLALLSTRVIPCRRRHPVAYRLYMELLKRYAFSLPSLINGPNYHEVMESINDVLKLYQTFEVQSSETGLIVVEFIFGLVWQLLDASLDDDGLLELTPEKKSRWPTRSRDMEVDYVDSFDGKRRESQSLSKINTVMAIEIIGEFFRDKVTSQILFLARQNMPLHWKCFIQHLRLLASNSLSLRNSKVLSPESLLQLTSETREVLPRECQENTRKRFHVLMARSSLPSSGQSHGAVKSELWLPLDLYLEDALNGMQVSTTSAGETLAGLVKALQAVNQTTWQDTFLGLWIAALRLVQRERYSSEGPVPRHETCLCMLLSVAVLAVVHIVKEDEIALISETQQSSNNQTNDVQPAGKYHQDLVSSLQLLDDFEGLLSPPPLAISLANQAAAKAMMFLSGLKVESAYLDCISVNDISSNCAGDLRHLIVESCIARNVLDTSAYMWPGYIKDPCNQIPRSITGPVPAWSSLMKGLPLVPTVVNTLLSTPATSLVELERLYEISVSGSDDQKISAANIFCGASLTRGWNVQEHTGLFIIRLLSPEVPTDYSGSESHLIGYAPFLNVLLTGISSIDCIHIFSLHGLIPHLAGALMPICEVFGACAPNMSWTLNAGEEISSHAVFSNAFTLLLRLWRFDRLPLDNVMGDVTPARSHLTPEYLLLVRNSQLASSESRPENENKSGEQSRLSYSSLTEPIVMDSFPKLKRWYRQHQECIASILSALMPGNYVHQIVEALLNMMFRKIKRDGQPLNSTTSGSSSSSASGTDDYSRCLKLPAWDILEAVPFVLDAALTACAHGKLSPRDLTTGLKDLADFLPASLATIVSYFSAEVTRGLWKPAFMNGSDWPSPAANLSLIEEQINRILAATGVNVPCLYAGRSCPVTIPLPLAALISLTITYKLDKSTDRYLNLVGPALRNLGICCPWPCMSIIAALWTQKVNRWGDFLIFSASQAVFHHNSDAAVQLLKVCFTTAVGLKSSPVASKGGVGALLGHGFGSHVSGGLSAVAPGLLYLRVHRAVRNVMFMTEEILSILVHTVRDIMNNGLPAEKMEDLKTTKYGTKYGQVSLASAMTQIKIAASLAASLVWITGGLNLVQSLIKETLPSWLISSIHASEQNDKESTGVVAMMCGYALAYFTLFTGLFAWGLDLASPASKRRPKVLEKHLEFLASALDGKISVGCKKATWRAYVTGYISLIVYCTPAWMLEIDVEVLKRVSKGLKRWKEVELAVALLSVGGIGAMAAAAEMIIETGC